MLIDKGILVSSTVDELLVRVHTRAIQTEERLGQEGGIEAMLRGNGAPIHTLDNAFYKAYSAASLTLARKEDSTKAVADRVSKNAPTTVPQTPLPNVTYGVGGVTIMSGGNAIAGVGVSGAPGGNFDEECARAAIAKIQDRMK